MPEHRDLEAGLSLIFSIRPRHAEAILSGRKHVELRRKRPNVSPGSLAFVYVSSPVKAVLGAFCVQQIISAPIDALWELTWNQSCINRDDYDDYFFGVSEGHAIQIAGATCFREPISLKLLGSIWPGFRPPQSFCYFIPGDNFASRCLSVLRRYCSSRLNRPGSADSSLRPLESIDEAGRLNKGTDSAVTAIARRYLSMRPGTPARIWLRS